MTTTNLIELLKENEFGGATGKPREVNFKIHGYGFITDLEFSVNSTDDGLYTAICFDVIPGNVYPEEEKHPCEECQEFMCDGCPYSDRRSE